MKTTARNFDVKNCAACGKELQLPTVHFMCGHSYHEFCVETEGIRRCTICVEKFSQLIGLKEDYAAQRYDTERFFKSLRQARSKFDVIADYYKEDLFADINLHPDQQTGPEGQRQQ
jgi:hypothetical protein